MQPRVKPGDDVGIIIDTNIFIAAEEVGSTGDPHSLQAAELYKLASELGFRIMISNGTVSDISRASDEVKTRRRKQLNKYVVLGQIPVDDRLARSAGYRPSLSANDASDLEVLSALFVGAADWLVTQDNRLIRRAADAGLQDKVFLLPDIIETLRSLLNKPAQLATVATAKGYQFPLDAEIFESMIADYPDFERWWKAKVVRERRDVLLLGSALDPEGLVVLKIETDDPHGIRGRVLKACTFKVAEKFEGFRRGELLIKATIDYARVNRCGTVYVEILPTKEQLIRLLTEFGFHPLPGALTIRGELVLSKELVPSGDHDQLGPLELNVRYGPGAIRVERAHVIPIRDYWHSVLLPEASVQHSLLRRSEACGNAIRKAYVCRAQTRQITPGDCLLFMRTGRKPEVTAIGVAEATFSSKSPNEIVAFVGNRTVYSAEEIRSLCSEREVLAVRFRLDRVLSPPWTKQELLTSGAIVGNVQSIRRVREGGLEWVKQKLVA